MQKKNIACAIIESNEAVITNTQSILDILMIAKYKANIKINKKTYYERFLYSQSRSCRRDFTEIYKLWWTDCDLR